MTSSRLLPSALLILCPLVRSASLQPFEAVEPHMGTLIRIKLYALDEGKAEAAFHAAFARVAALDAELSDYRPESELSRISVTAAGRPVPVSADLFAVLSTAQSIAAESEGAFDVTLGSLTHLWRQARKSGQMPDEAAVRNASAHCGFRKLHLDASRQTVMLDEPGLLLDAGGIAKGYAADESLKVLRSLGIESALVAASGDLAFSDAPPGKTGWSVGIDSLDCSGAPFTRVLTLQNAAVSTSGDTQQRLEANGKRYSHVLDPRTGMGLTRQLTVTVVARHGMEADALTKVVSVLGREKGLAFVEQKRGVAALVVDRDATPVQVSASRRLQEDWFERTY